LSEMWINIFVRRLKHLFEFKKHIHISINLVTINGYKIYVILGKIKKFVR